ncbi:MAG: fasciclin domain-containing protein [Bacteroidota bacterium]
MRHLRIFTTLAVIFSLLLTACQDDSPEIAPVTPSADVELQELVDTFNESIAGIEITEENSDNARFFRRIPTFRVLLRALIQEDLLRPVLTNRWTAFLPTDKAFAQLGINAHNVGEVEGLREILLYHVLPERIRARQFEPVFEPTLNGAAVEVSLRNKGRVIKINESKVIFANLPLGRTIGHVVDEVLLPPTESLVDIVTGNENFSILEAALVQADLVGAFTDEVSWTVFAPTNEAFVALLDELGFPSLEAIPNDILTDVLLYHVLGQRVYSTDLENGLEATALNDETFSFDLSGAPLIIDANGRDIELDTDALNIQATNGVVHVVKRVLLPPLPSM